MTTPFTTALTGLVAFCIRTASASPRVFWPTTAEPTTNTSVSHIALRKPVSFSARVKLSKSAKWVPEAPGTSLGSLG